MLLGQEFFIKACFGKYRRGNKKDCINLLTREDWKKEKCCGYERRLIMKTRKEALEYGLSFPDTYQDAPFHDQNWQLIRYSGNKKAFLWTYEREGHINLNVKVDPEKAY